MSTVESKGGRVATKGICVITYGTPAKRALHNRLSPSLGRWCKGLPVFEMDLPQVDYDNVQNSRYAKVTMLDWSPFDYMLYLDADTQVYGDVSMGFDMLARGFDLVIAPSANQLERNWLGHCGEKDQRSTRRSVGFQALQLQAGVFFAAKNARTKALWRAWHAEWLKHEGQDQGALLRAFYKHPVKVWLLGQPFNGGAAIGHHWGALRV